MSLRRRYAQVFQKERTEKAGGGNRDQNNLKFLELKAVSFHTESVQACPWMKTLVSRYTIMKYQNTLKRFQRGKLASYTESGIKMPSCSKQ